MAKQTFTTGQVLTAAQMTSLQQTAMGGGSTTAKTTSYVLTAADAGTVVAMNAAGATTITVNTGLFSAGDTVFIQNWGAGTCTVTAGTATVTTHGSLALGQWEGGTLYFTSASAAIFFDISQTSGMTNPMTTTGDTIYSSSGSTPARLGIGSTGQVLTVSGGLPSWATPAGGTLTLSTIASGNLPSASTLNLTGLTGDYYMLRINGMTSGTADSNLVMQFNSNTGTEYTSVSISTTNADTATYVDGTSFVVGSTTAIGRTNNNNYWIIEIYSAKAAGFHTATWTGFCANSSGAARGIVGSGYFTNATALTSIQIKNSDGYSFTAGTYELIGG